jgi:hypothetical protein
MCSLVTQTREDILATYSDALIAWSHGEPIDTAVVHREIETILRDFAAKVAAARAHKEQLES